MELRVIRTEVKERGKWADTIALFHPKMLLIILLITAIGHFLAPGSMDMRAFIFGMIGVTAMVLINYRVNEMHDKTTAPSLTKDDHIIAILLFSVVGFACAAVLAHFQGWWVWLLLLFGGVLTVVYNMDVHPYIHNRPVYGFIWGGMPLLFSGMTQAANPLPTIPMLAMAAWASVLAVHTLWLWGPTTCGRMAVCARAKGEPTDRLCHSPVLKCRDRLVMPKEVHNHMKVLISLNLWGMILITVALLSIEMGGI